MALPNLGAVAERTFGPQELSTYDLLMEKVLEKTANNVRQEDVERLMEMIAYHETGPEQRNFPDAVQGGGGPGRGLYQYELETSGGSGAGKTAMTRLFNILGEEGIPGWAIKYFQRNPNTNQLEQAGDVDFSELTKAQQDVLFLADKLQDPIAGNIAQIGVESDSLWWAKYHHKGGGDTTKFDASRSSYLNNRIE